MTVEEQKQESDKPESDANTIRTFWDRGLRMQSRDGTLNIKIKGRIDNDWHTAEIKPGDFHDTHHVELYPFKIQSRNAE